MSNILAFLGDLEVQEVVLLEYNSSKSGVFKNVINWVAAPAEWEIL